MMDPAAYLATSIHGGGDRPLYSDLKVISVPVDHNLTYGSFKEKKNHLKIKHLLALC